MLTGSEINEVLNLGAAQARYHKDGYWYDQLHNFPGILIDRNGYIRFETKESYEQCPELRHPETMRTDGRPGTLSVPNKISATRLRISSAMKERSKAFLRSFIASKKVYTP